MSRFSGCEYDGEGPSPALWEQAVKNALRGRRGQGVLRELRAALLALSRPRLIEGAVVREGEVCAMGALAAHRLAAGPLTLTSYFGGTFGSLREIEAKFSAWLDNDSGTTDFGQAMGLTMALSWAIAWENDEGTWQSNETPEERFRRVLAWVERHIQAERTA